jgi:hypothetical protein
MPVFFINLHTNFFFHICPLYTDIKELKLKLHLIFNFM